MSFSRLLVLDVDSTLIEQEVIELIARHAGTESEVAAVTERAMRGELDFAQSLAQRVATLEGVPDTVFGDVASHVTFSDGVRDLIAVAHDAGWLVGLVSGGFEEVVSGLAAKVGVTHFVANRLETRDGVLTGRTVGPVIDRNAKAVALTAFARAHAIPMSHTIAIGDGANDLGMMAVAGISVAYNAKPVVREAADIVIDTPSFAGAWERLNAIELN
jgi:phosphoserine phosphatase